MKKFGKFLALGLAGASVLTGGFVLSGCDVTNDAKSQTEQGQDENKVVTAISINADSLPNYIIKEKFNRTNIKATVTYEDNTTKVINVTESMLDESSKEEIKHIGQYNLTINYGGKTATMYANVVDERYLLKEVVEANLDKDVTIQSGDEIIQIDEDNKVIDDQGAYYWIDNNIAYSYSVDEGRVFNNKALANEYYKESRYLHSMNALNILENKDDSGRDGEYTIDSIQKDGINYILKATYHSGFDWEVKYTYNFNEDFLLSVVVEEPDLDDEYYGETITYNFNYAPITLEVPDGIKALQDSATIEREIIVEELRSVMQNYLKSDFEMSIFDNSNNTTYLYQQYDADNKVLKQIEPGNERMIDWNWVNGDYYYSYDSDSNHIYKHALSAWERHLLVCCFTFDNAFDNITVDISDDGQYYELVLTDNDDDEVWEYTYVFNNNEIAKIDVKCDGQFMGTYTYNKTKVVLEVHPDIKALESSATEQ